MLLLFALLAGLAIGIGRARWKKKPYRAPDLKSSWLIIVAFIPQLLFAYWPTGRNLLPDWLTRITLTFSFVLFMVFAWENIRLPGMPVLLIGFGLNLLVILLNGGWMPVSLQTLSQLTDNKEILSLPMGSRIGPKDILLLPQNTHFEFLADRFLLPAWLPYQAAFSIGDVLIAIGIFWFFVQPTINFQYSTQVESI